MGKSRTISKVNWSWDYGKVISEITFTDGVTQIRNNDNKPPTNPAHDIGHFICGFNGEYEWDYLLEDVKMSEYNAVFMENLLFYGAHINITNTKLTTDLLENFSKRISDHLIWFSQSYYFIPRPDIELRQEFLSKLDVNICSQHYKSFYKIILIENELKKRNEDVRDVNISLTMDSSIDEVDEFCYDYVSRIKPFLVR